MTRSKILLGILTTLVLAAHSFGQNNGNACCAYKLDQFEEVTDKELDKRVGDLFNHLNYPHGSTAYVITYSGTEMPWADRDLASISDRIRSLITFRGYDTSRFLMAGGGYRKNEGAEFFIVPSGADPPAPTNTVNPPESSAPKTFIFSRKALSSSFDEGVLEEFVNRKVLNRGIDENSDGEPSIPAYDGPEYDCDKSPCEHFDDYIPSALLPNETENLDNSESELTAEKLAELRFAWADKRYAPEIALRKGSHGVMIFYADDEYYDIARMHNFIEQGRDRLAAIAKMDPEQIEVIFGGLRHNVQVEYWIVPAGDKAPEPKPQKRYI